MLSSLRSSQGQSGSVYPNLPSHAYQQTYQYPSYNPYASTSSQPNSQNALQPYAGGANQQQQIQPYQGSSGQQPYQQPQLGQQVQAYQQPQQYGQAYPSGGQQYQQQMQQSGQAGPVQSYSYGPGQMQQQQQQQQLQQPQGGQGPSPGNTAVGMGSWRTSPTYAMAPTSGPPTQLQPQQLETVSRDEDPIYGPLKRARAKVERALVTDNEISPDLADMLQAPSQSSFTFRATHSTRCWLMPRT